MHNLVKEQKKSTSRSHFWDRLAVPKMRPQNRKIHSKGRPVQQTKDYNCVYLSNKHIELEQRRPAHAKPDFNWLSGPKNGTWKRTCGISCLRSLAPMWRFAMQHQPGNIHQSFATPRYSATPCYVLIQFPNVIDTISKRWRILLVLEQPFRTKWGSIVKNWGKIVILLVPEQPFRTKWGSIVKNWGKIAILLVLLVPEQPFARNEGRSSKTVVKLQFYLCRTCPGATLSHEMRVDRQKLW